MMLSRFTPSLRRYPWLLHFGTSTIFRVVPICSPMLTPASAFQNQMFTCLALSASPSMRVTGPIRGVSARGIGLTLEFALFVLRYHGK